MVKLQIAPTEDDAGGNGNGAGRPKPSRRSLGASQPRQDEAGDTSVVSPQGSDCWSRRLVKAPPGSQDGTRVSRSALRLRWLFARLGRRRLLLAGRSRRARRGIPRSPPHPVSRSHHLRSLIRILTRLARPLIQTSFVLWRVGSLLRRHPRGIHVASSWHGPTSGTALQAVFMPCPRPRTPCLYVLRDQLRYSTVIASGFEVVSPVGQCDDGAEIDPRYCRNSLSQDESRSAHKGRSDPQGCQSRKRPGPREAARGVDPTVPLARSPHWIPKMLLPHSSGGCAAWASGGPVPPRPPRPPTVGASIGLNRSGPPWWAIGGSLPARPCRHSRMLRPLRSLIIRALCSLGSLDSVKDGNIGRRGLLGNSGSPPHLQASVKPPRVAAPSPRLAATDPSPTGRGTVPQLPSTWAFTTRPTVTVKAVSCRRKAPHPTVPTSPVVI